MTINTVIMENENKASDSDTNEEHETSDTEDEIKPETNAGWVDSIAKILKSNKPKHKRTVVLSKAKKLTDVKTKKAKTVDPGFEIVNEVKEEKPDVDELVIKTESDQPPRKKRKEIPVFRVKPNILNKDRERTLAKIATKGVVQLFNAVRTQQKDIESKLEEAGPLERKREKVIKNIDKRAFLDVLMGEKSQRVDSGVTGKVETKNEDNQPTWSILRDDFMMGAKLKDWDKQMDDENDE